jgi:GNAT superfamily N-acetyltransferase
MIRKSTSNDKEAIRELFLLCFGYRREEPYEHLDDRYYLYFVEDKLVAMTGILYNTDYRGLDVDWTGTHPDYRNKGYMQELFKEMLKNIHEDVYCSCWKFSENGRIHLYNIMKLFDFEEVVHNRVHWKNPYNCMLAASKECVECTGDNCECYEDLYVRKIK